MTVLFFLHGLGQTPQSWQDQVTALPPGVRAHAPWLRGLRPDQRSSFDVGLAADEVLALIPQFTAGQVALCGVSLGATVALEAALRAPAAVSHLVLVSAQVNPPRAVLAAQRMAVRMMPARRLEAAGVNKRAMLEVLGTVGRHDIRSRLGEVRADTLVVAGGRDPIGVQTGEVLLAGIKGSELLVIPDAGPDVPSQAPEAFNEALYGFIPQA